MKKVLFFSLIMIASFAFGQKVKIKKNVVLVDNKEWLLSEEDSFNYTIFNQDKKELIFLQYIRQNPNGNQLFLEGDKPNYYTVKFIGTNKNIEIRQFPEDILKIIYKSELFNNDFTFNESKLDSLIEKYGNNFSKRANNNSPTVIINNNTTSERPRNGVNISIGR